MSPNIAARGYEAPIPGLKSNSWRSSGFARTCTGAQEPLPDPDIVKMIQKPLGILERGPTRRRVLEKVVDYVATFIRGAAAEGMTRGMGQMGLADSHCLASFTPFTSSRPTGNVTGVLRVWTIPATVSAALALFE